MPHGAPSGDNLLAAKENSKEVRKSHFHFGTDGNFMQQQKYVNQAPKELLYSPDAKERHERILKD